MNKFLKDLENELKNLKMNAKDIAEILADHDEMIATAIQEGLTEEEIFAKFGDPKTLAKDLTDDSKQGDDKSNTNFDDVDSVTTYNTEDYNVVKTFPAFSETVSLNIILVSDDLIISSHDDDFIGVYEIGIKKIEDYRIDLVDDTLTIKRDTGKIRIFNINNGGGKWLLLLPKTIKSNVISYHTVSGDTLINGISTLKFEFKGTNGDLGMTNVDLGKSKISTVNGDIEIAQLKASEIDLSIVNGNVEINKAIIDGDINANTVSGDFEISDVECNVAAFKTVSGDLKGQEFYPNEVILKSVSGDIEIINNDKTRHIGVISKRSVSGDINIK